MVEVVWIESTHRVSNGIKLLVESGFSKFSRGIKTNQKVTYKTILEADSLVEEDS